MLDCPEHASRHATDAFGPGLELFRPRIVVLAESQAPRPEAVHQSVDSPYERRLPTHVGVDVVGIGRREAALQGCILGERRRLSPQVVPEGDLPPPVRVPRGVHVKVDFEPASLGAPPEVTPPGNAVLSSVPVTQRFDRVHKPCPGFERRDLCRHVDHRLRCQPGYRGAPDMLEAEKG